MHETLPKKVSGDPDRLIQVAINIIGNAINNTFHDGQIIVFVHFDKIK
jgi:signal transduction histidine kinase